MPIIFGPPNQQEISLAAGANVTLSSSGSGGTLTVTIIGGGTGATGTGANIAAGTQTVGSGTIVFSNSNSISFGMSNSSVITATVSYPAAASDVIGASNLGNVSGTTGVVSGSNPFFVFAGGNNVTLSQSLNGVSGTITISAFTQTVQTQNLHNLTISGNTSGVLAAISSGTLTLVGGNNITLSQAGNAITISAPTPGGLQTGISGLSAGTTQITSGTASFANSNGVTFGVAGNTITASVSQGGNNVTLSGNTSGTLALISSGTLTLAGGNNVTLSQVGNAVTISGANTSAQSAQTQSVIQALIPKGNTTGTTGIIQTGSVGIAGGNNITISQSSGANSTNLTIIGAAGVPQVGGIGNTVGNFTTGSGSLVLSGGNNVTLSGVTNVGGITVGFSVPNTSSQTVQTQNLFDLQITSAAGGSTSGTTALISSGTLTLAAGSNITLSQNGNAITILGASGGTGGAGGAIAIAAGAGSTTGTTALLTGTLTIAAGNRITLSQAGGNAFTISASNPVVHVIAGNTTGTTASISTGTMTLAGGNNITLSQVGNAVTVSAFNPTFSWWAPPAPGGIPALAQYGQSSLQVFPMPVPFYLSASKAEVYVYASMSTSSNSSYAGTLSIDLGIYTNNASTLSLFTSGNVTYAFTNTSDNSTASLSNLRGVSVPINLNLTPGNYWLGFLSQTASANTNWITLSNYMYSVTQTVSGKFGAATNQTDRVWMLGMGHWTAARTDVNVAMPLSQIRGEFAADPRFPAIAFANYTAS